MTPPRRCPKCDAPERFAETENTRQVFVCETIYENGVCYRQSKECIAAQEMAATTRLLKNRVWQQLGPEELAEIEREVNGEQP